MNEERRVFVNEPSKARMRVLRWRRAELVSLERPPQREEWKMEKKAGESSNSSEPVSVEAWWRGVLSGRALVLPALGTATLREALATVAGRDARKDTDESLGRKLVETLSGGIQVERTVIIDNREPAELYAFWRNFENLPSFMKHLESVNVLDDHRSHWVTRGPLGSRIEWDAEVVFERENELLAWTSAENADVRNAGFVRFRRATGDRGTEVKLVLEYRLPGGMVAATLGKIFGEEGEQQVRDELRRFKMLMEAGEISTTEGQSSGRGKERT